MQTFSLYSVLTCLAAVSITAIPLATSQNDTAIDSNGTSLEFHPGIFENFVALALDHIRDTAPTKIFDVYELVADCVAFAPSSNPDYFKRVSVTVQHRFTKQLIETNNFNELGVWSKCKVSGPPPPGFTKTAWKYGAERGSLGDTLAYVHDRGLRNGWNTVVLRKDADQDEPRYILSARLMPDAILVGAYTGRISSAPKTSIPLIALNGTTEVISSVKTS